MTNEVESVLVFPEKVFHEVGFFTGVSREATHFIEHEDFIASLSYQPREDMEKNPAFKQVIPYCVIVFGNGNKLEDKKFFVYQRTKKGGESRLHDKYSLGVGGHVNPCDGEPSCSIKSGMLRELQEEISLTGAYQVEPIGLIYDDSNDVGKVHFGVVLIVNLGKDCSMKINDHALDNGQFVDYTWLKENIDKFENWSQLVIKELL